MIRNMFMSPVDLPWEDPDAGYKVWQNKIWENTENLSLGFDIDYEYYQKHFRNLQGIEYETSELMLKLSKYLKGKNEIREMSSRKNKINEEEFSTNDSTLNNKSNNFMNDSLIRKRKDFGRIKKEKEIESSGKSRLREWLDLQVSKEKQIECLYNKWMGILDRRDMEIRKEMLNAALNNSRKWQEDIKSSKWRGEYNTYSHTVKKENWSGLNENTGEDDKINCIVI